MVTKCLIEATHRNVHIQKHLFCQIFWREGEDIFRSLRDGKGRSCPVSCQVWECRSQKIKVVARNNNKPERYAPCQWEARWTTTRLWKAWSVRTPQSGTAWPEKARRLSTEPAQASLSSALKATRGPGLGTAGLALGFLLLLPPITEFFTCSLDLVSFSPHLHFSLKIATTG